MLTVRLFVPTTTGALFDASESCRRKDAGTDLLILATLLWSKRMMGGLAQQGPNDPSTRL